VTKPNQVLNHVMLATWQSCDHISQSCLAKGKIAPVVLHRQNFADILYISAIFSHGRFTLVLCMEHLETQVATSSLTLTD